MPEVTTTLREVKVFTGTSAKGPWVKTVFVDDGGTEYATFKGEVASVVQGFLNTPAKIEYDEKQNGQYTNRTLLAITPGNGAAPTPVAATPTAVTPTQTSESNDERQLRIMRQSGFKCAILAFQAAGIDPIQSFDEVCEFTDNAVDYFMNGRGGE